MKVGPDLRDCGGTTAMLIDVRDLEPVPRSQELSTSTIVKGARTPRPHYGFLVRTATQYGMVRQLQAISEDGTEIELFTNRDEALDWLHHQENPKVS